MINPSEFTFPFQTIRSQRKTIAIQITSNHQVLVRAPLQCSDQEILRFIESKHSWIHKSLTKLENISNTKAYPFTKEELIELKQQAEKDILYRLSIFSPQIGVTYNKVSFKFQISRWGSCSSKGNLNFNCVLMCVPSDVRDYVVVHELCHLKHMNHSPLFWCEVKRIIPNYKIYQNWLKNEGNRIIARLHEIDRHL